LPPLEGINFRVVSANEAGRHADELTDLYREVYAEPPYEWDAGHAELFSKRFAGQCRDAGFSLVEAPSGDRLIALGFGVTLAPTTPWWQNLLTLLPEEVTHERVGRTFALVELLVRRAVATVARCRDDPCSTLARPVRGAGDPDRPACR
jgi:hypothetical protein